MNPSFWAGRRVLITGNTGFKGSWLTAWLLMMGANVRGLALAPDSTPSLWDLLGLDAQVRTVFADINDREAIRRVLDEHQPEVVLHLAAQSLVRLSYREPEATFATNVVGTVSLMHQVAQTPSVAAVIVVTSDKCYALTGVDRGFREDDPMGGHDPYSASKGCTELAAASMRHSYFAPYAKNGHPARVATVRAGNVIGGGDWSADRLIPDIVRGCLTGDGSVVIRSPRAVRPWQHVLEPLGGYLLLAEQLVEGRKGLGEGLDRGWNFGPHADDERPVIEVAETVCRVLGKGRIDVQEDPNAPFETGILRLETDAAQSILGWRRHLDFEAAMEMTGTWYAGWAEGADPRQLTMGQIETYMKAMKEAA